MATDREARLLKLLDQTERARSEGAAALGLLAASVARFVGPGDQAALRRTLALVARESRREGDDAMEAAAAIALATLAEAMELEDADAADRAMGEASDEAGGQRQEGEP